MVQVLVAEDVGAISIALEDALTDAGYSVAGPFASCVTALEWLDGNQPDLALLDAVLSDGLCIELARALRVRAVPFLFLSGNHPLYGFRRISTTLPGSRSRSPTTSWLML